MSALLSPSPLELQALDADARARRFEAFAKSLRLSRDQDAPRHVAQCLREAAYWREQSARLRRSYYETRDGRTVRVTPPEGAK